ncbi:MAG: DUF4395 domain-containing protein [Candidatus Promineifilaceae bacterium]
MRQNILPRQVDHAALKTNQAFIIGLLLLAFVLNNIWLAAFVGAVMLLGTAAPSLALFQQIYKKGLRPAGLVKPDVQIDNPEPHRFAQGFGGVVVVLAAAVWLLPASALSWALVWLVILLASLNLFLGFCAGCFLYYQLNRLGVPGFHINRTPSQRG